MKLTDKYNTWTTDDDSYLTKIDQNKERQQKMQKILLLKKKLLLAKK